MSTFGWRLLVTGIVALAGSMLPAEGLAQTVVKYVHTDALGSVVMMTDQNRNVLERREYEPYGKQLAPLPVENGPGYTGHVLDALTGMVQMQQRYMDPGIGRFLSVDPVTAFAVPGVNFNRYAYAANNPYRFTDPDGRWIRDRDQPSGQGPFECYGSFCDKYQGSSPWIAQFGVDDESDQKVAPKEVGTAVVAADAALTAQGFRNPQAQGQFVTGNAAMSQWKGATLTQVRAARQLSAWGKIFGAASIGINGANFLSSVAIDDLDGMVSSGTGLAFAMGGVTTVGAPGALTFGATSLLLQFPGVYNATVTAPLDYHEPAIREVIELSCAITEC